MNDTKLVACGGLAFFEEKDFKKLSKLAQEGWILEGFSSFLFYRLRKGAPQDIQYSLDYQTKPDEEYFSFFESAGWSHVCSAGNEMHIFSAPSGTKPIYTDEVSLIEKYEREQVQMKKVALPALVLSVVWALTLLTIWVSPVILALLLVTMVVLVFTGMPYLAYGIRVRRLRKG
ncbi:DUF2812 domain-containing protein [Alkaliphilus hydrothermalis]|uniref:DUF2812 domain-containing protein n=1 Tax=Alkaliphilus hydrothermalis TaxID=1482730 RepID=A0ABS2NU58_9FIRM|nr:DUF2812 domain-containing protein [Alkaliphilus hydrothermalis]MBM7616119.1 hypothetical protein [Alkaliphilus hydrothermalis]